MLRVAVPGGLGMLVACSSGPGLGGEARRGAGNRTIALATPTLGSFPTPLGGRGIGRASHRLAAATLADSVLKRWGWRVAMADSATARLQTAWLYLPRGTFKPGFGSQCEAGAFTALRFTVGARDAGVAAPEFFVNAEALFYDGAPRAEAERLVRSAVSQVGADLTAALRLADARPDAYGPSIDRRWGELALKGLDNATLCGGVHD
ncbi:MAG TPA: hypothetical protein VG916_02825 [Gemmatimonadaceae bacterium]|nr:hypothetical protein [Gemmatimonadaceae bacterium]